MYDKFFLRRNKLHNDFKLFEAKHNINIFKKLASEKDERQFLSFITEINFGIFFDRLSSGIKYDKPYNNLTPDWTIEINNQTIIAEVVRLNPTALEKTYLDFEDKFFEAIHKIEIGCLLDFEYDEEKIINDQIDIKKCKNLVEDWLIQKPTTGETISLFETIRIELIANQENLTHACLIGQNKRITFDYRRLYSEKSRLVEKANKYNSIIESNNLPYIICIYIDTHAWFDEADLYQSLYGLSTEHLGNYKRYSHNIEQALFYSSTKFMTNVSGVLMRRNDKTTYFHNFSATNRMSVENKSIFLAWQHPYE